MQHEARLMSLLKSRGGRAATACCLVLVVVVPTVTVRLLFSSGANAAGIRDYIGAADHCGNGGYCVAPLEPFAEGEAPPCPTHDELIDFATNVNPWQLSGDDYGHLRDLIVAAAERSSNGGANVFIFGIGRDSQFWVSCNMGGLNVFMEQDYNWVVKTGAAIRGPSIIQALTYGGVNMADAPRFLETAGVGSAKLGVDPLVLPEVMQRWGRVHWDVILVDAPCGSVPSCPGRMSATATAAAMSKAGTHVLIHDMDREIETNYANRYFLGDDVQPQRAAEVRRSERLLTVVRGV